MAAGSACKLRDWLVVLHLAGVFIVDVSDLCVNIDGIRELIWVIHVILSFSRPYSIVMGLGVLKARVMRHYYTQKL